MQTQAKVKSVGRGKASHFRLAIYDLMDDSPELEYVGRLLSDTGEDQRYAREAIDDYNNYVGRLEGCTYAMGLFKVR